MMDTLTCTASQVLETRNSDSESDLDSENTAPRPQKKARRQFDWKLLNKFSSLPDAKTFIKAQRTWNYRYTRNIRDGKKVYHNCSHGRECSSQLYLLQSVNQDSVNLFSSGDHDHEEVRKTGLPPDTKTKIIGLYNNGVTRPRMILTALKNEGIEPNVSQITSFVQHNIRNKQGPRVVSLGQIESLCVERSVEPESLDEPYVIKYDVDYERKSFRVVLSTKRLLSLIFKNTAVQADATYKLMWEGFPVLMLGSSDQDRKFHPFCLALTSSETCEDFAFCFKALKAFSNGKYQPNVLIADCTDSITNGFRMVFGDDFKRIHCWAHVYRNLSKHRYLHILSQPSQQELLADISVIQLCKCEVEFKVAIVLLVKKWSTVAKDFIQYFVSEYVDQNSGWYEGVAQCLPKTNNGLEATNRYIKTEGTFHDRMNFGFLVHTLTKILKTWSEERNPAATNYKHFSESPTSNLKLETTAYQWSKTAEVRFRTTPDKQTTFYFIPATGTPKLKDVDIDRYIRLYSNSSWKTFDTYKSGINRLWKVEVPAGNWKASICSCRQFLKEYCCKHIIGIALKKGLCDVRPEAKNIPIAEKRKRGRPQKAKRALIVQ